MRVSDADVEYIHIGSVYVVNGPRGVGGTIDITETQLTMLERASDKRRQELLMAWIANREPIVRSHAGG